MADEIFSAKRICAVRASTCGDRLERAGHFGGSLLLFYAILYAWAPNIDTVQSLALSLVAATIAAAMSLKQDNDKKLLWGVFHRTWITHSLFTVLVATVGTYFLFDSVLKAGPLSLYAAIAVFSATMSHVLLDSTDEDGRSFLRPAGRHDARPALVQELERHTELRVPGRGRAHGAVLLQAHLIGDQILQRGLRVLRLHDARSQQHAHGT